ncbi:hypothetical protein JL720_10397 [Aureococcus anophagefferens]|nr:hypothetical protein JL720_10397 [Aureococcus anophagefferens]
MDDAAGRDAKRCFVEDDSATMDVTISEEEKLELRRDEWIAADDHLADVEKRLAAAWERGTAATVEDCVALADAQSAVDAALDRFSAQKRVLKPTLLSDALVASVKKSDALLARKKDRSHCRPEGLAVYERHLAEDRLKKAYKGGASVHVLRELERSVEDAHARERQLNPDRIYCPCGSMVWLQGDANACSRCLKGQPALKPSEKRAMQGLSSRARKRAKADALKQAAKRTEERREIFPAERAKADAAKREKADAAKREKADAAKREKPGRGAPGRSRAPRKCRTCGRPLRGHPRGSCPYPPLAR